MNQTAESGVFAPECGRCGGGMVAERSRWVCPHCGTELVAPGFVPNVPCGTGRSLGAQLARFVDGEEAAEARALARGEAVSRTALLERCATCAFRAGTVPNGCLPTVMDAIKCAVERVPFLCHESAPAGGLCAGWVKLTRTGEGNAVVPWAFSEEPV